MARDRPSPYDEGGLSAAAPPVGTPPYCIETRRSLLRGRGDAGIGTPASHRNTESLTLFGEVIRIHPLNLIRLGDRNADIVVDHELRELMAVD